MFNENHYVPVLKWKRGERTALEKLDSSLKEILTPLIEIQPIPFDHKKGVFSKTLDDHLSEVGKHVKTAWNVKKSLFVDVNVIYENEDFSEDTLQTGEHPVEFLFNDLEAQGIQAIPVTGILRHQAFHDAIKVINHDHRRGICLRLEESDLSDLKSLHRNIKAFLDFFEEEVKNIDIILDYKQILPQHEDTHINNIILLLAQFPHLNEWRTITLTSTAYPKTLQKVPTNSNGTLPRTEWDVYKKIRGLSLARHPAFGDYNITHPEFVNLDPRIINMAAGIRYTKESKYHIFRGIGVKNNGFSQMVNICTDLVNDPCYCGSTFSFGDQEIYDCANSVRPTNGNAETWVTAGINHHLTLVARDISILPVPLIVDSLNS